MKRHNQIIIIVVTLIVVVLGGGLLLQPGYAQPANQPQTTDGEPLRTVSVSGSGEVRARPDRAVVRLGVQTDAEMADEALSINNSRMQSLLDALNNAGVPAENIQTQTVRLQPRYQNQPGQQAGERQLIGYTASNTVEVQLQNIDRVGELLDAAVSAGGNTIEGVRFEVSTPTELLTQARAAAMRDAQQKAEQLVSLAGAELGDVLTINESSGPPRPVERAGVVMAEAAAVPVEPGTQSVTVNVQVTWLLR